MTKKKQPQALKKQKDEKKLDESLKETFPASDSTAQY